MKKLPWFLLFVLLLFQGASHAHLNQEICEAMEDAMEYFCGIGHVEECYESIEVYEATCE